MTPGKRQAPPGEAQRNEKAGDPFTLPREPASGRDLKSEPHYGRARCCEASGSGDSAVAPIPVPIYEGGVRHRVAEWRPCDWPSNDGGAGSA